MNRCLVVVDVQNDFVTGALANLDAAVAMPTVKSVVDYARENVWDLTMFQFMDAVQRARLIDSTNHLLSGVYAGTIDGKKIKNEKFNWMREIQDE